VTSKRVESEDAKTCALNPNRSTVLPLPKGEGEGIVRLPTVYEAAHRVLQPTVHGERAGVRGNGVQLHRYSLAPYRLRLQSS
jgi:hypothetical protein